MQTAFSSSYAGRCSHGFPGFLVPRCVLLFWGIFVRGLRVETFVRVLRSSRVNFKLNVNDTNVFRCVWIESLLFYFVVVFEAVLQSNVDNKVQFLVELLFDIEIVVSCLVG